MHRVFSLISVPADEEQVMRDALDNARINYYITPRAEFGQGTPGIWAHTEADAVKAVAVIRKAQKKWLQRAASNKKPAPTLSLRDPVAWALMAGVLLLLLSWFFRPVGSGW